MKNEIMRAGVAVFASVLSAAGAQRPSTSHIASDFNRDGKADFVLRNQVTGESQIWYMNGTDLLTAKPPQTIVDGTGAPVTNRALAPNNPDAPRRIVGYGKVNDDDVPDLIWQYEADGHLSVSYMGDPAGTTDGNQMNGAFDYAAGLAPGWRLVGFGYFNNDSVLDVVWENVTNPIWPPGQLAIWIMKFTAGNPNRWEILHPRLSPTVVPVSQGWHAMAVGDFGQVGSNGVGLADGVRDGQPDLALQKSDGAIALWIFGGPDGDQMTGGYTVIDPGTGNDLRVNPQDLRLAGTDDYGGTNGVNAAALTDIVLRNDDFCNTYVWFLEGRKYRGVAYFGPTHPDFPAAARRPFGDPTPALSSYIPSKEWRKWYDPQWRLPNENSPNLTARASAVPNPENFQLDATVSATTYSLSWQFPSLSGYPNIIYTIRFKPSQNAGWQTLKTLTGSSQRFSDSGSISLVDGQRYDFNVTAIPQVNGSSQLGYVAQTTVALNGAPLDNRGGILLLVDEALRTNPNLSSQMEQIISDLKNDLIADGWTVTDANAPRHRDDYTQTGFKTRNVDGPNGDKLYNIKNITIRNAHNNQGVRTVLIIGHVMIPYSGYTNPDGHAKRAMPADMYYGDLDGPDSQNPPNSNGRWTDTKTEAADPLAFFEGIQHGANDGRMDQSFVPRSPQSGFNGLELAIGRVDFARQPAFGTGDSTGTQPLTELQAEVTLIDRYFAKTRRFRLGQSPFPLPEQAATWSLWMSFPPDPGMAGQLRKAFGAVPVSADPRTQRSAAYLLGFMGGRTDSDADAYGSYSSDSQIMLLHKSSDFLDSQRVPFIGFHFLHYSFHCDWNRPKTMQRALLTHADYGLASLWGPGNNGGWKIEPLVVGDTLGSMQLHTVQAVLGFRQDAWGANPNGPPVTPEGDRIFFSIIGDPTLRLRYVKPPTNLVMTEATLQWTLSPDQTVSRYYLYKKDAATGAYVRATSVVQPVICQPNGTEPALPTCSVTLGAADLGATKYMVRATQQIHTQLGSYWELSQGALTP